MKMHHAAHQSEIVSLPFPDDFLQEFQMYCSQVVYSPEHRPENIQSSFISYLCLFESAIWVWEVCTCILPTHDDWCGIHKTYVLHICSFVDMVPWPRPERVMVRAAFTLGFLPTTKQSEIFTATAQYICHSVVVMVCAHHLLHLESPSGRCVTVYTATPRIRLLHTTKVERLNHTLYARS